jgi:hypothetical protein
MEVLMKKRNVTRTQNMNKGSRPPVDAKKQGQEPKLAFVKPKLIKHGDLKQLTFGPLPSPI